MATKKQVQAAKRNIRRAQSAARAKRTIAKLPASVRSDLGGDPAGPLRRRLRRRRNRPPG